MDIVTLDPTFEERPAARALAPALTSLEGATVGLLDNNKKNVGHFLQFVAEELTERHGVKEVVRRRKANMSAPAPEDVMLELIPCDAVIAAIGD